MTVKELLIALGMDIQNSGGRLDMEVCVEHNGDLLEVQPWPGDMPYTENGVAFLFRQNRVVLYAENVPANAPLRT